MPIRRGRGRPKMEDEEKKVRRIMARMSEESYQNLLKVLDMTGASMSDYVRTVVEEAVDGYLQRNEAGYFDDEY